MGYWLPLAAYLLGSVSSAVLVSRALGLADPRTAGSGNPGATNVLRLGGKKAAALTFVGDALKGAIPVLVARILFPDPRVLAAVAFTAFLGHLFPVFFGFRGGKGVATAFGALSTLSGALALALLGTWIVVAALTRYSSLAAIATAVLAPLYVHLLLPQPAYLYATGGMSLLLLVRHRANIRKLLNGAEDRIGR